LKGYYNAIRAEQSWLGLDALFLLLVEILDNFEHNGLIVLYFVADFIDGSNYFFIAAAWTENHYISG
jgi:hypothetical protein